MNEGLASQLITLQDLGRSIRGQETHGIWGRPVLNCWSMDIREPLNRVLSEPTPHSLWEFRSHLLASGLEAESPIWGILQSFHTFLSDLNARMTARQYSQYASLLDISALGGVMLEKVLESESGQELARSLFGTLMSEGLMALGTRQHIKAWEAEMESTFSAAGWTLYEQIWRLSEIAKPELDGELRKRLVDQLIAPILNVDSSGMLKGVLIGRLFQLVLAWAVAPLIKPTDS